MGADHWSSYAETVAPPDHWDLVDLIAIVSHEHKAVGSTRGHALAVTSPLQSARVADAPRRLDQCRAALLRRDFDALAEDVELDALMMHAVMLTSMPPLFYWLPSTLRILEAVRQWRTEGIPVCFTIDAGPNVHVITTSGNATGVQERLARIEGIRQVLVGTPGGPAEPLSEHLNPQDCG
jgi:diphosphomevalonate decarboxylase